MELTRLINHPDEMDRDTLYELRSLLALYPYFQTARLLMLQNLYLLHDPTFDEELRRAAIYITDRKVLFRLIEAAHYKLQPQKKSDVAATPANSSHNESRTMSLIDNFLETIPVEQEEPADPQRKKRKPTPADAAVDYVAYLLESEEDEAQEEQTPQLKGQSLIDNFIEQDKGKIVLNETPEFVPQINEGTDDGAKDGEEGFFTETLARIYIKQGRYNKALDILHRLNAGTQHTKAYIADQIRFLEKLIINNNKK